MRTTTHRTTHWYASALLALACAACGDEAAMNALQSPSASAGSGVIGVGGSALPGGAMMLGGAAGAPTGSGGWGASAAAGASESGASAAGSTAASGTGGSGAGGADAGAMPAAGVGGAPAAGTAPDAGTPERYEPCPPAGEACKILPLGDSITFGIGYAGGYRVELFRKAHAAGKQITFTGSLSNGPNMVDGVAFPKKNEGHSGWKIAQLMPLIPRPALQEPPHVILLMIGTNDIGQNDDLANAPERLGKLLDALIAGAPDALIVVAQLTPLSFGGDNVRGYNDAIEPVIEERAAQGEHVLLVDMFTGFPMSELGDGVHPNQRGYERMAGVWYAAIEDVLR